MRVEGRDVQIGPHGQILQGVNGRTAPGRDLFQTEKTLETNRQEPDAAAEDAAAGEDAEDPDGGRPAITGYESAGCDPDGPALGKFFVPQGADFSGSGDHCIAVKGEDGLTPVGRMQLTCEGQGVQLCFHGKPSVNSVNKSGGADVANGTEVIRSVGTCEDKDALCMSISAEDAALVSTGQCVQSTDALTGKIEFLAFTNFRPDTKWPTCLVAPMNYKDLAIFSTMGMIFGLVTNVVIWFACLKPKVYRPKAQHHEEAYGEEYGMMHDQQPQNHYGEMQGESFKGGKGGFDGGKGGFEGGKGGFDGGKGGGYGGGKW